MNRDMDEGNLNTASPDIAVNIKSSVKITFKQRNRRICCKARSNRAEN